MGSERKDYSSLRVALVSVKAILACVPVFVLPFALKSTAEFFVVGWGCVTTWFRPPFLYVVLNVVIVTLSVKSGALTYSSTSDQTEVSDDSQMGSSSEDDSQMNNSTDVYNIIKVVDGDEGDLCSTSDEDNLTVAEEKKVSKPGEEYGETQLVTSHLIEEIDEGQIRYDVCNEEKVQEEEEEEMLSAEELYEKSEMFIGNFYRELKLQQIE